MRDIFDVVEPYGLNNEVEMNRTGENLKSSPTILLIKSQSSVPFYSQSEFPFSI